MLRRSGTMRELKMENYDAIFPEREGVSSRIGVNPAAEGG